MLLNAYFNMPIVLHRFLEYSEIRMKTHPQNVLFLFNRQNSMFVGCVTILIALYYWQEM
jgi:hypothetical protein